MAASQTRVNQGTNSSASFSIAEESVAPDLKHMNKGEVGSQADNAIHIQKNVINRSSKRSEMAQQDLDQDSGSDSLEDSPAQASGAALAVGGGLARRQRRRGELERQLWKRTKHTTRQIRAVYRQIGIDPEQEYQEDELEDHIILKAVRDYNHSKFATDEHIIIEGIIKDVFQGSVPDLDAPIQDYGNLQQAIHQSFELCKLDYTKTMKVKAL